MLEVTLIAKLSPTEDPQKVLEAMKKLFPELNFEVKEDRIVGRGEGIAALRRFVEIIGREAIAPRTLSLLRERRRGDSILIPIDREVATTERISYDEEGEMGPMWLEVRGDVEELLELVRSLAGSDA
ncbi:MAG: hypothetical protein GXO00_01690 [Candidatus Diapherotrites archaeon]|nr:hypothetical protein [Candidatus Diapherotrites archaeon]